VDFVPSFLDFVAFLARSIEKFGPENSLNQYFAASIRTHTFHIFARYQPLSALVLIRSEWAIA
jgi:hypothetical protein